MKGGFLFTLLFLLGAAGGWALEDGVMRYIYNAPESELDRRYDYHWAILRAALEKTRDRYGPYILEPSPIRMSEQRQVAELERASKELTVMYLGTTPAMEDRLLPVRIPVDRNLGGYCVFLIRRERLPEFSPIHSLAGLKPFSFGLGLDWIDVGILRANGLKVVTGSSYEGLFDMLNNARFDIFLRAAVEVLDELQIRQARFPDLVIEPGLGLYYPMPMYFWFHRTEPGRQLARRVEEGMWSMINDGTYDQIFSEYQDKKITTLQLAKRRILRIENPYLSAETPLGDVRLWFNPATYVPRSP